MDASTTADHISDRAYQAESAAVAHLRGLVDHLRMAEGLAELVYWDERVAMPTATARHRARQREWLEARVDELRTRPDLRDAVDAVRAEDPSNPEALAMDRELRFAERLPEGWRARSASITSTARSAWDAARVNDNFSAFLPHLQSVLASQQELATALAPDDEPYAALLDMWEPGVTPTQVETWFDAIEAELRPLISKRGVELDAAEPALLDVRLDIDAAAELERTLGAGIGYDWSAGRSDPSTRAFCIHLAPRDVRITSRFGVHRTLGTLHSSLHELGHGLYAQRLGALGVPSTLARAPGLGIDESQSRLVENLVGRSRSFWEFHINTLARLSNGQVGEDDLEAWVAAMQAPRRRPLRVGADELTYGLHVILRFRIERAMVNGTLHPRDLPDAWRAEAERLFGAAPSTDREGCLQDVHWSIGQWGYFPTYLIGTMHASSLFAAACSGSDDVCNEQSSVGTCTELVTWLDEHVYRHGRAHQPIDLVRTAIGSEPGPEHYINHLRHLYG